MQQNIINKIRAGKSATEKPSILRYSSWLILLVTGWNFSHVPVIAEVIINQNTIVQPLTIEGVSGGLTSVQEITQIKNTATGYCNGFTRPQPNHVLQIDSFFQLLRLEIASDKDTTIVVQGSGGTWCNDDMSNANPMIEGAWQPGIYKVWIGSYQPETSSNYRFKITGQ